MCISALPHCPCLIDINPISSFLNIDISIHTPVCHLLICLNTKYWERSSHNRWLNPINPLLCEDHTMGEMLMWVVLAKPCLNPQTRSQEEETVQGGFCRPFCVFSALAETWRKNFIKMSVFKILMESFMFVRCHLVKFLLLTSMSRKKKTLLADCLQKTSHYSFQYFSVLFNVILLCIMRHRQVNAASINMHIRFAGCTKQERTQMHNTESWGLAPEYLTQARQKPHMQWYWKHPNKQTG